MGSKRSTHSSAASSANNQQAEILPGAPVGPVKQDAIFRTFAALVYFGFFLLCLFFLLRNCSTVIPGSGRAERAICPTAFKLANHFPIIGTTWDKLASDIFPIARPQEKAVFHFLTRLTTFVLGPLSLLLGWQFLKNWPSRSLVLPHSHAWSLFAVATAVAVQLEHVDNAQWAQVKGTAISVFAFWILFPIAVSVSTFPSRGGAIGGALRFISIFAFFSTIASVYEFAITFVPDAKGSPSIVDTLQAHPVGAAAATHMESARVQAVAGLTSLSSITSDAFDTLAEQSASASASAAPHVLSAIQAASEATTLAAKTAYAKIQEVMEQASAQSEAAPATGAKAPGSKPTK